MIVYNPEKWAGFHKLIQMRGSATPIVMPHCLTSTVIVIWVHFAELVYFPGSPYAHQIFTFGLSFLVIMRTNLSYSRYWEGISELVAMHSKWTDGVSQIIAFDELASGSAANTGPKFRYHVVHLMSLMSAAIICKFQEGGVMEIREHVIKFEDHFREPTTQTDGSTDVRGATKVNKVEPEGEGGSHHNNLHSLDYSVDDGNAPLPIVGGLSPEEELELQQAEREGCPIHFLMQKLVRMVSRRHKCGGLAAPPPIVSRIFQELSNGFLAYQGAAKVASIPFPFPYAQIVQYLQLAFVLSCPFVVVAFVDELAFQMFFTFLGVFTFCSLNAVASQLEDPFGHDENDLPLRQLHAHFVAVLDQLLRSDLNKVDLDSLDEGEEGKKESGQATEAEEEVKEDFEEGASQLVEQMERHVSASTGSMLHEEALREMFDSLDKNGNGVLDHDELKVLCNRIGLGFSDEKYVHMIKRVDPEGIGEVSFSAFWTWFMKKHRKMQKGKERRDQAEGASP